jgi:hypothetical protein
MTDLPDRAEPTDDPPGLSRRGFLERTLVAGAGAGLLGGLRLPLAALAMPDDGGAGLTALATRDGDTVVLGNDAIRATWSVAGGALRAVRVEDLINRRALDLPGPVFTLALRDGGTIDASTMRIAAAPVFTTLTANPRASRAAERVAGRAVSATLEDPGGRLRAIWRAVLRDGSMYIRQEIALQPLGGDLDVAVIMLVDVAAADARVVGSVAGSPVVAGNFFLGVEDPLSASAADDGRARCRLEKQLPVRAGQTLRGSSVIGVARSGQLRRDFLRYVERERAHPYRTFLHYNSWYDLGYFSKFDEAGALAVIAAFGAELHRKRGVTLDSFLFDDGWDDPKTLWRFHDGFPNGFTPLRAAAAKFGAAPGVWMSPWGGYGKPKEERLTNGRAQGFETNEGGFALSGPVYYQRFRETCLEMIRRYGVNQFKFDGTGNANRAFPGSAFGSDFEAAINLIGELRAEKPDLYVNLTTGTYPSPFWLRHADSIWRGGDDHDFAGVGSDRAQWNTYRDADTYAGVVKQGPLYPINSLMLHGLIYARHARKLNVDPFHDFAREVHSYFGTGTQLQEMYVTPALLTPDDWDAIAEHARWSRRNADVLVDTHWVGGDPAKLDVYGWASWSPRRAIVTLRNPSDRVRTFPLDAQEIFELPEGARRRYDLRSPWRADRGGPVVRLVAGTPTEVTLQPFEVLTLERRD